MSELSTETVFVTGASSGFGAAIARRVSAAGAKVILTARRRDRLEALARELPSPSHVAVLDVRDRSAVDAALAALPEGFREVTALVNNAGLALGLGRAHEADLDEWLEMVDANVKGVLHCTRALLPGMVARRRGYVVNLGSVAATYPYPGGNVYAATKAFLHQFSLGLRADLLGTNVRVTCIEPGMAETEFSLVRFQGDAQRAAKVYEGMTPLGAEDLADTVHWLLTRPPHVNVNVLEVMPTRQAFGPFAVDRG